MTDLAAINVEMEMMHGDDRPLAEWVEQGRPLTQAMRLHIAKALRGEQATRPGNRRTWSQAVREKRILSHLRQLERSKTFLDGGWRKGLRTWAIEQVAEMHGLSTESIKKYMQRHGYPKRTG